MDSYLGFSTIYDELIKEDINYEEIADFILKESRGTKGYLDLGCGTGILASLLGKHFDETYLVDQSSDMLTLAEEKLSVLGIRHQSFAISMSAFNFGRTFSLITSSIDAVNYLLEDEEVEALFERVYGHLAEDGVFIFDINSPYKLRHILGNHDFVYTKEDLAYTWENFLEDDVLEMYLNFFIKKGVLYERVEEVHYERVHTQEKILFLLRKAGFKEVRTCDAYGNEPVGKETERITFVVRKEVNNG